MFKIKGTNLHWMDGLDESLDLCLHGDAEVQIGGERLTHENTAVSATALYLLKSLTEDHIYGEDNQMLPCCGHFMVPNDALTEVRIIGCPNGVDWSVIHENGQVRLITESKREAVVSFDEYREAVFAFADEIESFYKNSKEKVFIKCEEDRESYPIFWEEWRRRRNA